MAPPRRHRELELLRYIEDYLGLNGRAPTVREMAKHLRVAPSAAHRYLEVLRDEGRVTWDRGRHNGGRSLRVVKGSGTGIAHG